MGAFKELKRSLKIAGFKYDKLLYSKKIGKCSIVLYELGVLSYLLIYYDRGVQLSSLQSDIVEFDMDLIHIKNNPKIPKKLKYDYLNKASNIANYLMENVWVK